MIRRSSSGIRLDENVWLTMGGVCLIALLVLAFRYSTQRTCVPITIKTTGLSFTKGYPLSFNAETTGGSTFEWNFGDGATAAEYTPSTQHAYAAPGRYTVTVTVDGQCAELQNIIIKEAPVVVNNSLQPVIILDDTVYVNEPMTAEDISPNSTAWEWRFEEGGSIEATSRKASHVYKTAGTRRIFLRVNGRPDLQMSRWVLVVDRNEQKAANRHKTEAARHTVTVIQLPAKPSTEPLANQPQPAKPEEKPKAPEVTDDQMASLLRQVNEGSKTVEDFAPYLCSNLSTPVFYNGDKMTFSKMCDQLKSIKKGKIKKISVGLTRNEQNCIITMNVSVERKRFLGL
jgi:hypothetical protein